MQRCIPYAPDPSQLHIDFCTHDDVVDGDKDASDGRHHLITILDDQ